MALNENEVLELVRLLNKVEWPLDRRVFHALVSKTPTVPQELAVLDQNNRILLIYRQDEEYTGYHCPGTVLRDNETVPQAVARLLESELPGVEFESVKNIGWIEISRGTGSGENPTRHEVSLLWLARVKNNGAEKGIFSPLDQLPENTLSHHLLITSKIREHLATGRFILGA